MATASYRPAAGNMGDPFRTVYSPRLFSGSSSNLLPPPPQPPHQPFLCTSPSRIPPYPSQYPQQPINDYYIGQVTSHQNMSTYNNMGAPDSNYTCIGAPVGFGPGGSSRGMEGSGGRDRSLSNQEEGLNWGRSYAGGGGGGSQRQQRLDHCSSINRYQDGL